MSIPSEKIAYKKAYTCLRILSVYRVSPRTLLEFLPTKSERNTYVLVCRGNLPTVFEGITYCMQYL